MNIRTFDLERIQSLYENTVDFNLTESGFHPLRLDEILDEKQLRELTQLNLGYGQTNGDPRLRDRIAGLYENAGAGNVLVTNGSAEANFVAAHTLLNAGDEVVIMIPNYMQLWGIVEEMMCTPVAFHMREENNWAPDLEELARVVNPSTKMIAVCNPNNPTGYVLTSKEMEAIVSIAKENDAWIYSDEIYRGAELDYRELESFYGKYDKVMVNGGLSKSYALPGLRLGWLVGQEKVTDNAWAYRDYTSICSSLISQYVGEIVLRPKNREKILNRNRKMLNENLVNLQAWLDKHGDLFSFIPPQAGGMAFMRYALNINSTDLSNWLREQESVFIIPGDCYGMDGYIRIGVGERSDFLLAGLEKMSRAIQEKFKLRTI